MKYCMEHRSELEIHNVQQLWCSPFPYAESLLSSDPFPRYCTRLGSNKNTFLFSCCNCFVACFNSLLTLSRKMLSSDIQNVQQKAFEDRCSYFWPKIVYVNKLISTLISSQASFRMIFFSITLIGCMSFFHLSILLIIYLLY